MGLPFSWAKGVVEREGRYYPLGLMVILLEKRRKNGGVVLAGNTVLILLLFIFGNVEDKILVPKLPKNYARCARCARCGHSVDGPYCQGCSLLRKKLEEDMVTYFQTSKILPSHPMIVPTLSMLLEIHSLSNRTTKQEEKRIKEEQVANAQYWKILACCDDDDDYNITITPVLSIEKPDNSLSIGDEHLDTIPATESDEVIKSNVKDLVPIPSESEGIPDTMCDVHLVNNPTPLEAKDHFEIVINSNDDISSSDDDSLYNENIEYVEASPLIVFIRLSQFYLIGVELLRNSILTVVT
nr:hypothetical protein [Tanacetum cinerariifolium]